MSDPDQALQQSGGDGMPARPSIEGVEDALLDGDLSKLSPSQRVSYMKRVCDSVGLNPLTKPFRYIRLNGQLTLYATRDAAEQLRKVHGISITDLEETWRDDLCIFRAYAKDRDGRTDVATGAVDTSRSSGQNLANDIMKAETKAKRRVTLSLAGLGWLDETEVSDIPDQATEEVEVDYETGEVQEQKADQWYKQATDWLKSKAQDMTEPKKMLAHFEAVPSEHPVDDWPQEYGERAVEAINQVAEDSGKAKGEDTATSPTDQESGTPQGTETTTSEEAKDAADLEECMARNFDEAYAEGKEDWESISEDQLTRLHAIAGDEGWDKAALNRLVKDELGWISREAVPYGDPYDEICEALEDERLRYHMSRDPDTQDLFDAEGQDANAEEFEEGDEDGDLPF